MEAVANLFREIKSPYRIDKVLGQGVFTAAYLATHQWSHGPAVVRVLRSKFVDDHAIRNQFIEISNRSLEISKYHPHQNLVCTLEFQAIVDRKIYYTLRNFVQGVTLQNVLDERKKFEPLQVLEILRRRSRRSLPCTNKRIITGESSLPTSSFVMKIASGWFLAILACR